jgi:serine/threonine protein kinase
MIGESLGNFKISDKLGEGGMGQVFRAQDSKLGREVAIKVLPDAVVQDSERLARFEREAKVLASLNHPNIGAIYGLEEVDGKPFLILELVEGSTLQERISQGPLSVNDALAMARQIATALEAAHAQGIIHRDLKPANVKIDPKGNVKVLDFGLAKAWEPQSASGSGALLTASPTMTQQMTEAGVLLGTAAYMSPEQARGKEVDKRSDIWAFGAVLLEMLTGRQSFGGETVTDVIAAIVAREPEYDALPADTPQGIRRLLRRCLEKETDNRLHDIADARIEIEEIEEAIATGSLPTSEVGGAPRKGHEKIWMATTAVLTLIALTLGWMMASKSEPLQPVVRAQVSPPEGMRYHLASNSPGIATVAPDGRSFAFAAVNDDGDFNLWVRKLDQLEGQPIQNTDGARYSFWSADGRHIAFFGEDKLRKVEATGGPVLTLAEAPNGKGGSWSSDPRARTAIDILVFYPTATGSSILPGWTPHTRETKTPIGSNWEHSMAASTAISWHRRIKRRSPGDTSGSSFRTP